MSDDVEDIDYLNIVLTTGKHTRLRFRKDILTMPSLSDIEADIPSIPYAECKQIYNQYVDSDGNLIVVTDE